MKQHEFKPISDLQYHLCGVKINGEYCALPSSEDVHMPSESEAPSLAEYVAELRATNERWTMNEANLLVSMGAEIARLREALKLTLNAMRKARDEWPNYSPDVEWVIAWDAARKALGKD